MTPEEVISLGWKEEDDDSRDDPTQQFFYPTDPQYDKYIMSVSFVKKERNHTIMANKKVKTNFGEIEKLHKDETSRIIQTPEGPFYYKKDQPLTFGKKKVGKTHQAKAMKEYLESKIQFISPTPECFDGEKFPANFHGDELPLYKQITEQDIIEMLAVLDKESKETEEKRQIVLKIAAENRFHPSSRQPDDLSDMPPTDEDWQGIEDTYNEEKKEEKAEAEWITQIRNYCRENEILPTHLIEAHKMLQQIPDT